MSYTTMIAKLPATMVTACIYQFESIDFFLLSRFTNNTSTIWLGYATILGLQPHWLPMLLDDHTVNVSPKSTLLREKFQQKF